MTRGRRTRSVCIRIALLSLLAGAGMVSPAVKAPVAQAEVGFLGALNPTGPSPSATTKLHPTGVAVNTANGNVYATTYGMLGALPSKGSVNGWDSSGTPIGPQFTDLDASRPLGVAVNSSTGRVYVSKSKTDEVAVVDGSTMALITNIFLDFGAQPNWIAVNSTTNKIYVAQGVERKLLVLDGSTNTETAYVDTGVAISGIAVDATTNKIYVARPDFGDVAIIDGASNTISDTVLTGQMSDGIAINSTTKRLYTANPQFVDGSGNIKGNSVTVIDLVAKSVVGEIRTAIGVNPHAVAVDPTANRVYAVAADASMLSIIRGDTNAVVTTADTGINPLGVAADPASSRVYVANTGNNDKTGNNDISIFDDAVDAPTPQSFFFAEGTTRGGFQTYVTLFSPDLPTTIEMTYYLGPGQGGPVVKDVDVPARSRVTVNVNTDIGSDKDVSIRAKTKTGKNFFAERVMYFDGVVNGAVGGTVNSGWSNFWNERNQTITEVIFAEGTTRPGFTTFLTLLSPGASQSVDVTYYYGPGQGGPLVTSVPLPADTRVTITVNDVTGPGKDVSTRVASSTGTPFYAERPMYFNGVVNGAVGAHDGSGIIKNVAGQPPVTETIFPEGATHGGMQTYFTVLSDYDQWIDMTYMVSPDQGANITASRYVLAGQRYTIDANAEAGFGKDIATKFTSVANQPFYVERPAYFNGIANSANGGHVGLGLSTYAYTLNGPQITDFYLAEGTNRVQIDGFSVTGGFQGYLTMMSELTQSAILEFDFAPGEGDPLVTLVPLPQNKRVTVDTSLATAFSRGANLDFSMRVTSASSIPVYVERPMYFNNVVNGATGGTVGSGKHL